MNPHNVSDYDLQKGAEIEESIIGLTESYSEISIDSNDSDGDVDSFIFQKACPKPPQGNQSSRPNSLEFKNNPPDMSPLQFLHSAGTVEKDGDMNLFFSQDLENKIRMSNLSMVKQESYAQDSPRSATPCLYRQALQPSLPPLDASILNALEADARKVATAVDSLTENLAGLLHSVSALTVDCLETYRDAVCNTCDAVDSNIKSMYQLMAKCEELSKTMKPVYQLAEQIKEVKRLLDLYENSVTT